MMRSLGAAALALGCLVFFPQFFSVTPPPKIVQTHVERLWRQRVVIFLVDTLDDFAAHGTYVQSVLRQHCPQCELQTINLRGDLGLPSVIHALQQVQTQSQTYGPSTTTLVNLSLGTYTFDQGLHNTVRALEASGLILIASAGNDNTSQPFYPAAFQEVLGVCSTTRHTQVKAAYSNYGTWVSLCAPGLQYVTRPLQHGELASGTSLAAPMVTGVLGQLLLEAPCASPRAGSRALLRTAEPVADGKTPLGAGLLNAAAAHHYMRHLYPCAPPVPFFHQLLTSARRLGTHAGVTLAVLAYFVFSIFTVPFLIAFVIEHIQHRTQDRQHHARPQEGTPAAIRQRYSLLALRCRRQQARRMRRQDQIELCVLQLLMHRPRESA